MARTRERDYIFQRGSVWWIKLQPPRNSGLPRVERSLGTKDKAVAWTLALPIIEEYRTQAIMTGAVHRAFEMLRVKERNLTPEQFIEAFTRTVHSQAPGTLMSHSDGTKTFATEDTIFTMGADGKADLGANQPNEHISKFPAALLSTPELQELRTLKAERKRVIETDIDQEIVDRYVRENKLDKDDESRVRATLRDLKLLTAGKLLADTSREDAKAFIDWMLRHGKLSKKSKEGEPDRSPMAKETVKRRIAQLKAAINLELREDNPRLRRNPFSDLEIKLYPKLGAEEDGFKIIGKKGRVPYDENDVRMIKANLDAFTDEEKLMVVWHIASSVRPGGLYSIISDEWTEEDEWDAFGNKITHLTRSVMIESDKDEEDSDGHTYGRRRLPIPQAVLDLRHVDGTPILPERISGPIWTRNLPPMLVMINRKLKAMGVNRNGKVFYSGRHRAMSRFRAMRPAPSKEMELAIMGHTREMGDAHHGYGHPYPMYLLKPVIDRIGF